MSSCVFVCKMNTILPWVKLAYEISCMPMQINPPAIKSAQIVLRQHARKQRQRQRAAEEGGEVAKRAKRESEVCEGGNLGEGESLFPQMCMYKLF